MIVENPFLLKGQCRLLTGNVLKWGVDELGKRTYFIENQESLVLIWDTYSVSHRTLQEVIEREQHFYTQILGK